MNHERVNSVLRALITNLLNTGNYKKRDICVATFGGGSSPQFEHFVKGSDVGINPLSRIFESFGYELEIVAIPKDSNDASLDKGVETLDEEFIKDCTKSLTEYLNNIESTSTPRGSVSKVFSDKADNLLKNILNQ